MWWFLNIWQLSPRLSSIFVNVFFSLSLFSSICHCYLLFVTVAKLSPAPNQQSWAELALFSDNSAGHRPPGQPELYWTSLNRKLKFCIVVPIDSTKRKCRNIFVETPLKKIYILFQIGQLFFCFPPPPLPNGRGGGGEFGPIEKDFFFSPQKKRVEVGKQPCKKLEPKISLKNSLNCRTVIRKKISHEWRCHITFKTWNFLQIKWLNKWYFLLGHICALGKFTKTDTFWK